MINTTINFNDIPLSALSSKSRNLLSVYLDPFKILPSSDGLNRDWRGICHLSGLANHYEQFLASKSSPTFELLQIVATEKNITLDGFFKLLGIIDRWDVIDDTKESFQADAVEYLTKKERNAQRLAQISDLPETKPKTKSNSKQICVTTDDAELASHNLPLQQYDAFILFADSDIDFATEMINTVEGFGFKVCVKQRDLLPGINFEHDAIRRLLTQRCERLIVILSPDFVESPLNEFISNLAQSLGIAQEKRKIIPCLYKPCELPEIFQHMHLLNYERSRHFFNFWDKLRTSLQHTPEEINTRKSKPSIQITITDTDTVASSEVVQTPKVAIQNGNNNKLLDTRSKPISPISLPGSPNTKNKIWPPQQKLRESRSMINITDIDQAENNNNTLDRPIKKPKWFNKLSDTLKRTPHNIKHAGSETNLAKQKDESKKEKSKVKIWKRIKIPN